jgi:hypothetical protein
MLGYAEDARRAARAASQDVDRADSELRLARSDGDAGRAAAAGRRVEATRRIRERAAASEVWRATEARAATARLNAAKAEVPLRRAELELRRAQWLDARDRGGNYALRRFERQRAALRDAWEAAVRRQEVAVKEAEAARRRLEG